MADMTAILIPARAGSQRIPGKNIKELNGYPLVAYRCAVAKSASALLGGDVCIHVATDDWRVSQIAERYGISVLVREEASSTQADIVWLQEVLPRLPATVQIMMILRPTSPFLSVETVVAAHARFITANPPADSLRVIRRVREHPGKMWVYHEPDRVVPLLYDQLLPSVALSRAFKRSPIPWHSMPTQQLPLVHVQTGGLEITTRQTIERHGSLSGLSVMPYELASSSLESLDINTDEDWAAASSAAAHLPRI